MSFTNEVPVVNCQPVLVNDQILFIRHLLRVKVHMSVFSSPVEKFRWTHC